MIQSILQWCARAALLLVVALALSPAAAVAQTIQGRLLDAENDRPIDSAW